MFSIWHEVFVTCQSFWKQVRSISEMSFYGKIVTINDSEEGYLAEHPTHCF